MVVDMATDTKTKTREDPSWRIDSVCREHPTQLWFAASSRDIATAKALCGNCVVQPACLEFALSRPELLGIWAATTPSERAVLRRAARTPAADGITLVPRVGVDDHIAALQKSEEPVEAEPRTQRAPEDGWLPGEGGPPAPVLRDADDADDGDDAGDNDDGDRDGDRDRGGDALLTPAEAAQRLGVTPNTVTRWSRAGKISAIQTIGGHRRYRTSEIERVLRHSPPLQ
jgi:excisionase family DNA binding protein